MQPADKEKTIKVKRKYLKQAKAIPESELDANDVQIVVVASLLEELEDGKIPIFHPKINFLSRSRTGIRSQQERNLETDLQVFEEIRDLQQVLILLLGGHIFLPKTYLV
jgi:hypothetical protein